MKHTTTKPLNVLVIEDNEDHLYFIKKGLSDTKKYTLKIIVDGAEAYQYLLKPHIKPDIVLLDQFLPNMDGLKILKKLKKVKMSYPILFFSVDNSLETIQDALDFGAAAFIDKDGNMYDRLPKKIDELCQKIKI